MDAAGAVPRLEALVETDDEERFPLAGSFVRFLLDEAGVEAFHALARASVADDPAPRIRADFEAAYGESLDVWWERWIAFLRS